MKRKLICILVLATMTVSLFGCSSEVSMLESMGASESESSLTATSMSNSDKEAAVYKQVSDRSLLDLTALDALPSEDKPSVDAYMVGINSQLSSGVESAYLNSSFVDYLSLQFEETPYSWGQDSYKILGVDAASRSIVVDVTYKTTSSPKPVKADSKITKGEDNYDKKMEVRFSRWMGALDSRYGGGTGNLYDEFVTNYGDPAEIFASQRGDSLSKRLYQSKEISTYSCKTDTPEEQCGASMTIRYVLSQKFTLGVNQGLECRHMYMTAYTLDKDPTQGLQVKSATEAGNTEINNAVDKLLHSYYTAIDESNHDGLYKLVQNYAKYDKYMDDVFDSTYRKNAGYTISLFSVEGKKIVCGVTLSRKVRARNTNMTFPIYTDRYMYTLELVGDVLQISNEVLLSSKISGEPLITESTAETEGFADVKLSMDSKKSIEKVVADLGVVQLQDDLGSDKFGSLVDMSISNSVISAIKENLSGVLSDKKACWITRYNSGYSNYASLSVKELYQRGKTVTERDVVYSFIKKGDSWYVCDYGVNSSNVLSAGSFTVKGALCVLTKDGIDTFTSQAELGN